MEAKPYKIPHPFRKLNTNLIDCVVNDIGEGSTHKLAALCNGITPRILEIWQKQGQIDIEHEQDSLCAYLVRSLAKVKKKEVVECRKVIRENEKGHKGAEWTLEHAYWRDYGSNAPAIEVAEKVEKIEMDFYGEKSNVETDSQEEK